MILPIKGFFLLSVYLLHFASSSDSMFDLFFDQTETRKARSSALHVTGFDEFNKINVLKF